MRKPVFCILVSLFILFLVYKKVQKITSSEDRYLREKHKKSWIITRTKTVKKSTISQSNVELFNDWFKTIYGIPLKIKVERKPKVFPNEFYDIHIDCNKHLIHCAFDHSIVGGETITKLISLLTNSSKPIKLPSSNTVYALSYLPYFLYHKPYQIKSSLKHTEPTELTRYIWDITTSVEGSKYEILYTVLMKIYACITNDAQSDIVCYLPIAFINDNKYQYNNIGLIWITFHPEKISNYIALKEYLLKRKYQAGVSNFILNKKIAPNKSSKDTRKQVDAVISMTYAHNPICKNVTWTYYHKPDYPIYLGIGTRKYTDSPNLETRVSLTINTTLFHSCKEFKPISIKKNRISY